MVTRIHAFGPNGELSPGASAALAGLGGGGGASALDDLTDVDTTGATTGDVLKYNGTSWVADTDAGGGGGGLEPLNLRYTSHGDSITAVNQYQPYIVSLLGLAFHSNAGVGGQTMTEISGSGGVNAITNRSFATYQIVTILHGTNDFRLNAPIGSLGTWATSPLDKTTYFGAYRTAIDHILTSNPICRLFLCTPLKRDAAGYDDEFTNTAGHKLIDYVNAVRDLGEFYGLPVIDLYALSGINKRTLTALTGDGLHPNAAGYERVGRLMADQMRAMMGTAPAGPTDTTAPTTPTDLTATPASYSVALSWTASTDNVAVVGYEYRVNGGTVSPAGSSTTYTVTGLAAATAYTIDVRAYDAAGNRSGWASVNTTTSAAPVDTTPPTPGTLAASNVGETSFALTVTGATDNVALHAQPYAFSTNNGSTWSAWQSSPTYQATGLIGSTTYQARHKVRDAAPTPNEATGTAISVTTDAPPIGAISPSSIHPNDLTLWLAADDLTGANNSTVNTWPDKSIGQNPATLNTGSATLITGEKNSLNVVRFDPATQTNFTSAASAVDPAKTIVAVVKAPATSRRSGIISSSAIGGIQVQFDTSGMRLMKQGVAAALVQGTWTPGQWYIVTATWDDAAAKARLSLGLTDLTEKTITQTLSTSNLTVVIGGTTGGEGFYSDMAEVATWSRVLTTPELTTVINDLATKWGVSA